MPMLSRTTPTKLLTPMVTELETILMHSRMMQTKAQISMAMVLVIMPTEIMMETMSLILKMRFQKTLENGMTQMVMD